MKIISKMGKEYASVEERLAAEKEYDDAIAAKKAEEKALVERKAKNEAMIAERKNAAAKVEENAKLLLKLKRLIRKNFQSSVASMAHITIL